MQRFADRITLGQITTLMCAAWFLLPEVALAYSTPQHFARYVQFGGSEGRWFTGSPADGYACDACHTGVRTNQPKLLPPKAALRGAPNPAGPLILSGLPETGYLPGKTYEVTVTWPEYAERARAGFAAGAPRGFMGVNIEILAESGRDSGSFTVPNYGQLHPGEACILPDNWLATRLYRQPLHPYPDGLDEDFQPAIADRPTSGECTAANGVRCIVAITGCGSERAHFLWTAPSYYEGAIWVSAGLVATDERTSDPYEDSVTLVSYAMPPAAAGGLVRKLEASSCAVGPGRRIRPWALGVLGAVVLQLRRRRSRRTATRRAP